MGLNELAIINANGINWHSYTITIWGIGGWESLGIVLRYTQSARFEDSLKNYHNLQGMC